MLSLPPQQDADDKHEERSRLIDHFKVAYAIIIGIAITDSIKSAAPWFTWNGSHLALILFAVLFVTVVPMFHGGDRSLDLKYLNQRVTGAKQWEFILQTTSLLITAILFVLAADNIPHRVEFGIVSGASNTVGNATVSDPDKFYFWMAATVLWDVLVLIREYFMNPDIREDLVASLQWVPLNLGLGLVCLGLGHAMNLMTCGIMLAAAGAMSIFTLINYIKSKPTEKVTLYMISAFIIGCGAIFLWLEMVSADPASEPFAYLVLGAATVRTILDYSAGKEFMFPDKD